MSAKREIVIQDTCILLDLVDLNLIEVFFQMDFEVLTTPQVTLEITNTEQWKQVTFFIENGRLIIDGLGDLADISGIADSHSGISFADRSVLELALRKQAMVLSSDGSLRKSCNNAGLEVHGVLWIIETLCLSGKLEGRAACARLKDYERMNPRSPKTEIALLVEKLMSYAS